MGKKADVGTVGKGSWNGRITIKLQRMVMGKGVINSV